MGQGEKENTTFVQSHIVLEKYTLCKHYGLEQGENFLGPMEVVI